MMKNIVEIKRIDIGITNFTFDEKGNFYNIQRKEIDIDKLNNNETTDKKNR
jgi:hypothetical protein